MNWLIDIVIAMFFGHNRITERIRWGINNSIERYCDNISFDENTKTSLASLGHHVSSVNRVAGGLNAIMFENELMIGAACHRADGSPAGLSGGYAMPSKPGDAFRDY